MSLDATIKVIKIHPAIGLARLSTSSEHYVFGDPGIIQPEYKDGDRIKRQAVQFRLFAYGENNQGLFELTEEKLREMDLRAIWSVDLCNDKTANQRQDPSYSIKCSGDTSHGDVSLFGRCGDFEEGQRIPMGELTTGGLFIPPVAGIYKKSASTPVPDFGMFNRDISDNSSDGMINVRLEPTDSSTPAAVTIEPAWVSVGPQNFAPEFNDHGQRNLLDYLEQLLSTPNNVPTNPVNRSAQTLDREMLERGTAVFAPGIELSGGFDPSQFYSSATTGDPDEIRFKPQGGGAGVTPGSLTSRLCSPWQFDFHACTCSWWPNQRPDLVFKDDGAGAEATWLRKIAAEDGRNPPGGNLDTNQGFIDHVDELGIVMKTPGDPNKRGETERHNNIR